MRRSLAAGIAALLLGVALPAFTVNALAQDAQENAPAAGQEPQQPAFAAPTSTEATPAPQSPVSAKLQDLIGSKLSSYVNRKPEQTAVEAFYRGRNFQPLWTGDNAAQTRGKAAVEFLRNVRTEGLDPRDYPTPDLAATMTDDAAAENELKLTASLLAYARHASAGRVSFTRVSGAILYPTKPVEPAQVLSQLASANDVRGALLSFEPQHPGFKALKAQLAKELAAPGRVADAPVADEGRKNTKKKSGKTVSARTDVTSTIIANMERWRWLPRDLGTAHVMVNVPDYTLGLNNNGRQVWKTKIVVGKPGEQATPLLTETMKYLTVNPTWNVPPSIIRNEYLPALERDADALERNGLKIGRNPDGSIRVYQPPGDKNALGRIRFNFPNPFLVYQHDTPNKSFFAREERALSHGCMRVQHPDKYAEALLAVSQPQEGLTADRIRGYYGDNERTIKLQKPIPVHITYQTAFVDESGQLKLRKDIYGLDAAVLNLLRGDERQIADIPIARNYDTTSKPVMARLPSRATARRDDGRRDDGGWVARRDDDGWSNRGYWGSYRGGQRAGDQAYASYPRRSGFFDRAVGTW